MKNISKSLEITTDDGSNGNKSLVTEPLRAKLGKGYFCDFVFAVGPLPMMKAVCDLTAKFGVKTFVSEEVLSREKYCNLFKEVKI